MFFSSFSRRPWMKLENLSSSTLANGVWKIHGSGWRSMPMPGGVGLITTTTGSPPHRLLRSMQTKENTAVSCYHKVCVFVSMYSCCTQIRGVGMTQISWWLGVRAVKTTSPWSIVLEWLIQNIVQSSSCGASWDHLSWFPRISGTWQISWRWYNYFVHRLFCRWNTSS